MALTGLCKLAFKKKKISAKMQETKQVLCVLPSTHRASILPT